MPSIEPRVLLTPGSPFTPMPALYSKLNNRPYSLAPRMSQSEVSCRGSHSCVELSFEISLSPESVYFTKHKLYNQKGQRADL